MTPTLYEARLESQTDEQRRRRTVSAASPDEARKIIEQLEGTRAAYSISDRQSLRQITTRRHADGVHANVNLDVFADTGLGGRELLEFAERDHHVEGDGKVYGPNLQVKAHLQAHYQSEPYKIVSLEPVEPNVDQIITALTQLHGNKSAWKRVLKELEERGIPLNVVTGSLYGLTSQGMIDGSTPIVWSSATIKGVLTTSTYTPNQDTHHFFSDVTNEVASSGTYVNPEGVAIGTKTSTYDSATDQIRLGSAAWSVTGTTITARRFVLVNDTAGATTTDPIMGWADFGADVSTTAGTFQVTPDPTGWIVYDVT